MRVGMGYDVHKLVEGRKLILGGVEIPYEKGLLGHSDADVMLHAVMDALLGAAALGDIGLHFPDTDPKYKGASSIKLLEHVGRLLEENGYVIENIDATIIAQRPKMRPHIDQMRENMAKALKIDVDQINVYSQKMPFTFLMPAAEAIIILMISDLFMNRNKSSLMKHFFSARKEYKMMNIEIYHKSGLWTVMQDLWMQGRWRHLLKRIFRIAEC